MNNKKHIINLETFRDMLHVCPRVPGQSFDELPFEAKILKFLRFLRHSDEIRRLTDLQTISSSTSVGLFHTRNIDYAFMIWEDFVYQIEHKKQKKGIEMNTTAYKEYYACATGVATPKPKASARKKRGDSDTSLTPLIATPTPIATAAPIPRLSAAAKGKQSAKAKSSSDLSKAARTEAEQMKIVLRRSRQETHISQHGGASTDEETGSKPGVPDEALAKIDETEDTESVRGGDEVTESEGESDEEETRQKEAESFDPIPRTPKGSEDEGNDKEDQDLRL
nr:hypothetical protein [Tanacetum cinerariifolium]GFA97971.1 hypothetical protein [Tanacetum cinerariifolium]